MFRVWGARSGSRPSACVSFRPSATLTQSSTSPKYIHLKVHSAYSLLEGALPIGKIAKLTEAAGMPAVGLSDTNNLFGVLEFSEKLAAAGIQPIAGMALDVDFRESIEPAHA